jgi:SAM-dependent methyltransferase
MFDRMLPSWVRGLRARCQRALHFWRGPTARQVDEARRVLGGREHYQLYEDRYRGLYKSGNTLGTAQMRSVVHRELAQVSAAGLVPGPGTCLLDLGCGPGDNAAYCAQLGYQVTGVDISATAIAMARELARGRGLSIDFRVANVLDLAEFANATFDLAMDIGCLHMLVRMQDRGRYLRAVRRVLRPGGAFFLLNRVARRDVIIADEEAHILRGITLMQERPIAGTGACLPTRGCGSRNASLRQYQVELEASGFEVLSAHRHQRFGTIVARVPQAANVSHSTSSTR